ncbi:MAG: hypothetical protein WCG16_10835 [Methylococcales bacterium]
MGIKSYLNSLDKEQLKYAKDYATSLLETRNQQPRKTVWTLEADHMNIAHFHEHQYIECAEKLLEYAKQNIPTDFKRSREHELKLVSRRLIESEYDEWFK